MRIIGNARLSVRVLASNPVRTAVAVLATAIGTAGVLVLSAIGQGARGAVLGRIQSLGSSMLIVMPAPRPLPAVRAATGATVYNGLALADADAMRRAANVRRVAPSQDRDLRVRFGNVATSANVLATTADWLPIREFAWTAGRFITAADRASMARVAVIGANTRANLYPDSIDPVGTSIRIGAVPFRVIGVLASNGVSISGASSEDDRVIIPLETGLRRVFNTDYLGALFVQVADERAADEAQRELAAILGARHPSFSDGTDAFVILNPRTVLETELAARTAFQRLLVALGLLSLAVASAGILSIMLLSARERRGEIGLRVAVGARRTDIAVQFLTEAVLLAGAGALAGTVLGAAVASAVSASTQWNTVATPSTAGGAALAALGLGVVAGLFPAWRAAATDPIRSLRPE